MAGTAARRLRSCLFRSLMCFGLLSQLGCSPNPYETVQGSSTDGGSSSFEAGPMAVDGGGTPTDARGTPQPRGDDGASTGFEAGPLPTGTPKTTVLVGSTLVNMQRQVASGATDGQQKALTRLVQFADAFLSMGPWSVMDKQTSPPSKDKHDYMSQAPYYWPADAKPPLNPGTPMDCTLGPYGISEGIQNKRAIVPPALTGREAL